MQQMTSSLPHERRIQYARQADSDGTDGGWVFKLGRAGKNDGAGEAEELEGVLKSELLTGERATVGGLDLSGQVSMMEAVSKGLNGVFSTSSCTMICTQRSKPHNPTRLAITAATVPAAATVLLVLIQRHRHAPATQKICQLMNQIPARMVPIRCIRDGPSQVADISNMAATPRRRAIIPELTPMERR